MRWNLFRKLELSDKSILKHYSKKPVVVGDNTYTDTEFGHHYALKKEAVVTSEDRAVFFSMMKAYWEN